MRESRWTRLGVAALGLAFLVGACGSTVATASPTSSLAPPSPSYSPSPAICPTLAPTPEGDTADHTIAGIFVEGSLHFSMGDEDWAARAQVVRAALVAIGPSSDLPGDSWTSTEITVDVSSSLRGSMQAGRTTIIVSEDLNDCHYRRQPDRLQAGREYIFILGTLSGGTRQSEQWIEAAWPIDSTDTVQTLGGPMSLTELQTGWTRSRCRRVSATQLCRPRRPPPDSRLALVAGPAEDGHSGKLRPRPWSQGMISLAR